MNASKIIKGVVGGGRYTVTAPIVKEDYGLYLQIEGVDLPSSYQVDFSNSEDSGTSITMVGSSNKVLIPRQFIETGKDIFAFLYVVGSGYGRTVYKFRIPNKTRPDRTTTPPTPEEQSVIDQTISALNDAVDRAEDAQEAIEGMTVSAETLAEGSTATVTKTEQDGVVHLDFGIPRGATGATGATGADGSDGVGIASTVLNADYTLTITLTDGTSYTTPSIRGASGADGTDGSDGNGIASVVLNADYTLTLTFTDGTTYTTPSIRGAQGEHGERGLTGADGISPTVTITPITGGHRITITDADGSHSADIMDGTGNVDDVQINGTSIVEDGVANVPVANENDFGVVKVFGGDFYGIRIMDNGQLRTARALDADIKVGWGSFSPITAGVQNLSTFYGLAKAAGDTTQSQSSNAVGVYTDSAKSKIQTMLGIADLIGNSEGATASQAYSVGDVLLHDGKLYKVTASITQGSAIVPNTNCTQTTIIDLLRGA